MGLILTGDFYRPDEQPKRRGSHSAPESQAALRFLPLLFLLEGVVIGLFLLGLGAWLSRVIVQVVKP
jgi:hypothetical protein